MAKFKDLTNQKFGKLLCLYRTDRSPGTYWMCQCDCGNRKEVRTESIRYQNIGCGCESGNVIHGFYRTDPNLCDHYYKMISRCKNVKVRSYTDYGARGITVCEEWLDPETGLSSFINWANSNNYEIGLTIERKDVNGNYCPENCMWIPAAEQAWNKRNNIRVSIYGQEMSLRRAFELYGNKNLKYETMRARVKAGWDALEALTKDKREW